MDPRPETPNFVAKFSGSRDLRQHLSLPYATRRFGRRPYPIPTISTPLTPRASRSCGRESLAASHVLGTKDSAFCSSTVGIPGGWELGSPPDSRNGMPAGGQGGLDSVGLGIFGIGGQAEGDGDAPGDPSDGDGCEIEDTCAEWIMSFSSSLELGVTMIKVSALPC